MKRNKKDGHKANKKNKKQVDGDETNLSEATELDDVGSNETTEMVEVAENTECVEDNVCMLTEMFCEKTGNTTKSNATFLVLGDVQFKNDKDSEHENFTVQAMATINEMRGEINGVVILGNLLSRFDMKALALGEQWVCNLATICTVYLLVGPHERPDNSHFLTNEHPYHALSKVPNVHVVTTTTLFVINDLNFTMIPYVPAGKFQDALLAPTGDLKYLESCSGVFAYQPDRWCLTYPPLFSGQQLKYETLQSNCICVGSPRQITNTQTTDNAACYVQFSCVKQSLETTNLITGDVSSHPFAQCWNYRRVKLFVSPKTVVHLSLSDLCSYQGEQCNAAQVQVVVHVKENEKDNAQKSIDENVIFKDPKYQVSVVCVKTGEQSALINVKKQFFLAQLKQTSIMENNLSAFNNIFA